MTPHADLEERLRDVLRRPEGSAWPDGDGAFERFLRRRARRGRALAAGAGAALIVLLAAAVLLPDVLPRPAPDEVVPVVPGGTVARDPARGFEVPVPPGWKATLIEHPEPVLKAPGWLVLVPEDGAVDGTRQIVLDTAILDPDQHPGLPPGEDPGGVAGRTGSFRQLDDRGSPLGRGRRSDRRPYVWRTRLLPDEVGEFAVAWPYHCRPGQPCPPGNRYRVLLISPGRSDDPAERRALRQLALRVVETVRPITNARPGGLPTQLDPALEHQPVVTTDTGVPTLPPEERPEPTPPGTS